MAKGDSSGGGTTSNPQGNIVSGYGQGPDAMLNTGRRMFGQNPNAPGASGYQYYMGQATDQPGSVGPYGGGFGGFNQGLGRAMMGAGQMVGGWMQPGQQPNGQGVDANNPLFQNMDPRLVSLFQKYGINPTGTGTGNSDINYWNQKMNEPGADQNYYLQRLESDFGGTGPDLGNNPQMPSGGAGYGGGMGNLAGRYYQQPMQRNFGRYGQQGRWGFGYGQNGQMNRNRWGIGYPKATSGAPTTTPTPKPDTSENP